MRTDRQNLRILTFCTIAGGGAGAGSIRRVRALRGIGVDARILSVVSNSRESFVGRLVPTVDALNNFNQDEVWSYLYGRACASIMGQKGFRGYDVFSNCESIVDFRQLKHLVAQYDVVHFHWVVGMIDYVHLAEVAGSKPIIWTTGDMNPFTGGCHYSEGCNGYTEQCRACPQVPECADLPHATWTIKDKAYNELNITVVCPSEYIAGLVRKSSLLGSKEIVVIPNAYPIEQFRPLDRVSARNRYGLPLDRKLVMFCAHSLKNRRKGGDLLGETVKRLLKAGIDNLDLLCVGDGDIHLPMRTHHLGKLDENEMPYAYSAADVFVSLTREDVGPMTVVEALLCGTPVVGFSVGLLPEIAMDAQMVFCAPPGNLEQIIDGIKRFLSPNTDEELVRRKCRESAIRYGDPETCALRHLELYQRVLNGGHADRTTPGPSVSSHG